ncbi:MAG: 50S ribosomal protein L19 [Rhabdochlamydiaceae bacterium]|nr:50S ribosomal protein L19 [Rhabdochlamydiaceae bacterium]
MNQNQKIQEIEAEQLKSNLPVFRVGDTVNVHMRIIEGEKERIQMFQGTVISRRGGGLSETMSLYRFSYGAGIERVFMIHSPKISKIEVVKFGKVRKSKLYYLRGSSGRASKVKEQIGPGKVKAAVAATSGGPEAEPAT